MSRRERECGFQDEHRFVRVSTLLPHVASIPETPAIGAPYDDLHKCTYSVEADGTVSCKGCGKGTVKKVSHMKMKMKKPAMSTKSN